MSVSLIHVRMEELVWMAFTVLPACAPLFMPGNDVKVLKRSIYGIVYKLMFNFSVEGIERKKKEKKAVIALLVL